MSKYTPNTLQPKLPLEEWRDVPGYEGIYQASNLGRVRSLDHIVSVRRGDTLFVRPRRGRVFRPQDNGDGRKFIILSKDGVHQIWKVHRVITAAFLGSCPEGLQVNHINGDPSDNRICNLEYVTPKENMKHRADVLGMTQYGTDNPANRLSEDNVREIRKLRATGMTYKRIADTFGVTPSAAQNIIYGKTWAWLE